MFYNLSTKMYHEKNCVKNHADDIAALGNRALIITGKNSSRKNGSLDAILNVLQNKGISSVVFDEVEENPSVETVLKASETALKEKTDLIIGVGGGSPLDASKSVAVLAGSRNISPDILYDPDAEITVLPIVAVPTTCGTGSEVTGASVLTLHESRTKRAISHKIYPDLALVDTEYLNSAPADLIRSTALDALAHLIESFLHKNADDYGKMSMEKGLSLWGECAEYLKSGEFSREITEKLMKASVMAGISIKCTGTTIPHGLSYRVTYETGLAHGKACAVFLPGYLKEAPVSETEKILGFAGFGSVDEFSRLIHEICGKVSVGNDVLELTVSDLLANRAKLGSNSFEADENMLRRIAYSYFE